MQSQIKMRAIYCVMIDHKTAQVLDEHTNCWTIQNIIMMNILCNPNPYNWKTHEDECYMEGMVEKTQP